MAKVWITQRTKHDYAPALRFGEPVVLFGRGVFPDELAQRVPAMTEILQRRLMEFSPLTDYILPDGDYFCLAHVVAWLVEQRFSPLRFLKWDREHQSYYPISLTDRELEYGQTEEFVPGAIDSGDSGAV